MARGENRFPHSFLIPTFVGETRLVQLSRKYNPRKSRLPRRLQMLRRTNSCRRICRGTGASMSREEVCRAGMQAVRDGYCFRAPQRRMARVVGLSLSRGDTTGFPLVPRSELETNVAKHIQDSAPIAATSLSWTGEQWHPFPRDLPSSGASTLSMLRAGDWREGAAQRTAGGAC